VKIFGHVIDIRCAENACIIICNGNKHDRFSSFKIRNSFFFEWDSVTGEGITNYLISNQPNFGAPQNFIQLCNLLFMEIVTRQITAEDAPAVNKLTFQLGYPMSEEQTLQNIKAVLASKDHEALVSVYQNKVVGWIGVTQTIMIESLPYCEINGLVIDENYRGKGIGKLLIEKAKQWAREKGNDRISLRCNVKRAEAHLFYRHLGFQEIKKQTKFEAEV
jgi:GNAT superfamily N-acetyltransferase